jgi:hypothetical protein
MSASSGDLLKRKTNAPWGSLFINQCAHVYSKSLLPEVVGRRLREEESRRIYGVGEASAGDSVVPLVEVDVPVEDSVVEAGLVVSVVVGGLVAAGLVAGSVVSVFCSHAARSAAPARMQMYFFIVIIGRAILL